MFGFAYNPPHSAVVHFVVESVGLSIAYCFFLACSGPRIEPEPETGIAGTAGTWTCPEYGVAFPEPYPEQIRKHPENALRANSEFPGFVRLEIPESWKIKQIPSPD